MTFLYKPPPLPPEVCRLCFGRGWFLLPGAGGYSRPMPCDKCKGKDADRLGDQTSEPKEKT
jgi:hypothetical protein